MIFRLSGLALLVLLAAAQAQDAPDGKQPAAKADAKPAAKTDAPDDTKLDPEAEETERALEWVLATRIAHDNLTPKQAEQLRTSYEKLAPSKIRSLVMVYEYTYGVRYPREKVLEAPVDPTQAKREWLLAYRIVYDRFTDKQAAEFNAELDKMTPSQIRVLAQAYEQKEKVERRRQALQRREQVARAQATPGGAAEAESESVRRARANLQAWESQNKAALARAQDLRTQNQRVLESAGAAGTIAAHNVNQRLTQSRGFSNRMYSQRSSAADRMYTRSYSGPRYSGWGRLW